MGFPFVSTMEQCRQSDRVTAATLRVRKYRFIQSTRAQGGTLTQF